MNAAVSSTASCSGKPGNLPPDRPGPGGNGGQALGPIRGSCALAGGFRPLSFPDIDSSSPDIFFEDSLRARPGEAGLGEVLTDRRAARPSNPHLDGNEWPGQLRILGHRFSAYGLIPDMDALSIDEQWGLLRFLKRIAAEKD